MKQKYKVIGFVLALLVLIGLAQTTAQTQASGFFISNGRLLDANGNDFIIRGINHPHTWYPGETSSFANIKNTGANAVRVVLSSGQRWTQNSASDVANVIQLCKNNRLICVLEVHDTTGFGEEGAAATLAQAASYWTSLQSVLAGEEAYVIINIGNEPYGNNNTGGWVNDTINAIAQMRSAGLEHTIMVDAPNWGQDWQFLMRDNAAQIFNSDPDGNTLFDIHMYGVFDTAGEVQSYLTTFVNAGLPLVIGEFGHNHSDGNPDEDAIMSWAESLGIGYIGWSWSGNSGGVEYLDMVNGFNPNSLTSWGERIINGANGIAQTSQEASVYGGINPTNTPDPNATNTPVPTATSLPPTATPLPGGACVVEYDVVNQWNVAYQADVTITNNTGAPISGWTLTFTHAPNQTLVGGWNATLSQNGNTVTASNPAGHWNGTINPNGGSVTFGLQATHDGLVIVPTDFVMNGTTCNQGEPLPTATSVPPTATSVPPTATSVPPTATSVLPTATSVPPTATSVPPTATSAPPTSTSVPPTATPGSGGSCVVDYDIVNQWNNGFQANVTITNNGSTAVAGYTLAWDFTAGEQYSSGWNATYAQSGTSMTASNGASYWNSTIGANGGSVTFGFLGTHGGTVGQPASFTLNGQTCN